MHQQRLHFLFLVVAVYSIVCIHGEHERVDDSNEDLQVDFDDQRDEVIETIKRFLTKKKTTTTTTAKPNSGAISALFTTTSASTLMPTTTSSGSKYNTGGSSRYGSSKVTLGPIKDACGSINPCQNGGSCKTLSSGSFYCFCGQDYYGKNCEKKFMSTGTDNRDRAKVDHCAKNPCKNNGECVGLRTTFYCRCKLPYYGTTCDKTIKKREELIDESDEYVKDLEEDRDDLRQALAYELMK